MGGLDDEAARLELDTVKGITELARMLKDEVAMPAMSPAEYSLTAARIGLASAWLGSEALVTGNLWLATGTSAAGLLVALALARYRNGPGPPGLRGE